MSRRKLPHVTTSDPIRVGHINRLSWEVGRLDGLISGGLDLPSVDNTAGRFFMPLMAKKPEFGIIRFEILSVDLDVASALVDVLGYSCGTRVVGPVTVYDELGCLLDEAAADLVGRMGYAAKMKASDTPGSSVAAVPASGSAPGMRGCRWEIIALCCPP